MSCYVCSDLEQSTLEKNFVHLFFVWNNISTCLLYVWDINIAFECATSDIPMDVTPVCQNLLCQSMDRKFQLWNGVGLFFSGYNNNLLIASKLVKMQKDMGAEWFFQAKGWCTSPILFFLFLLQYNFYNLYYTNDNSRSNPYFG